MCGVRPIRLKNPNRFRMQHKEEQARLDEQWTRSRLIDEVYLSLMSIKDKYEEEGIRRRKYEEQIRKKMLDADTSPQLGHYGITKRLGC
jgi:hypothetical protein